MLHSLFHVYELSPSISELFHGMSFHLPYLSCSTYMNFHLPYLSCSTVWVFTFHIWAVPWYELSPSISELFHVYELSYLELSHRYGNPVPISVVVSACGAAARSVAIVVVDRGCVGAWLSPRRPFARREGADRAVVAVVPGWVRVHDAAILFLFAEAHGVVLKGDDIYIFT